MKKALSFDEVLIIPSYSEIITRKSCNTEVSLNGVMLNLPIFSANMDTVTESQMTRSMIEAGGMGVLHRFQSIDNNVKIFLDSSFAIVSVGVNDEEKNRAKALYKAGLQFAMSYVGASTIAEFKEAAELVEITNSGMLESKPQA
jgi:IMP dehydrogenase